MRVGDRVLYIYNKPFEGRDNLKGAIGTVDEPRINSHGCIHCVWTDRHDNNFTWWVPVSRVRKLKESELS